MALYINEKDEQRQVTSIYVGKNKTESKVITAVYKGLKLIWQYIKSCFGRGYWINDKQWSNRDAWKN